MNLDVDLAVVGSGFAGSLISMIARRLGYSVALVEKEAHPRFVIGESSTPLANLLLEELALRYDLPRLLPLTKWGTWQATYSHLTVGIKRGFTFCHHVAGKRFDTNPARQSELLVAASPHDDVADTQWFRADFDAFLVDEANAAGVTYLDRTTLKTIEINQNHVLLHGNRSRRPLRIRSRFVIDATGTRGFLHRTLKLPEIPLPNMPPTEGLYTHFTGVKPWAELHPATEAPPYPPDAAALHHIFDGGWIWVLRFNNGVTSAGTALTHRLAHQLRLSDGAHAWERLLERVPSVHAQFKDATAIQPWIHASRLGFLSGRIADRRWALLPSAAGFVDPLLSTGFALTLLGVQRLARLLEDGVEHAGFLDGLETFAAQTTNELLLVERLVAALYAVMDDFELFIALSKVYFAAASFTEVARRLGRPELAGASFLLGDNPWFTRRSGDGINRVLRTGNRSSLDANERLSLLQMILDTIRPFDVAGLTDPSRRHWYPVRAEDLLAATNRLKATPEEMATLLRKAFG